MKISNITLFLSEYKNIQARNEQKLTKLFYAQQQALNDADIELFYNLVGQESVLKSIIKKNNNKVGSFIKSHFDKL